MKYITNYIFCAGFDMLFTDFDNLRDLTGITSVVPWEIRDRINAEIVQFYANKIQKMHHQNFNVSQDARH